MIQKVLIIDFNRTLYDPDLNELISGALDLLSTCKEKGYRIILLGKGDQKRRRLITDLNIEHYFDSINIVSEKNVDQLKLIRSKYPEAVFYTVGDRIKKEITLGNKMGFNTIWFCSGKFSIEVPVIEIERPCFIAYTLSEVLIYLDSQ